MMIRDEFADSDLTPYLDQGQQQVVSALEVYPDNERAFLLRAMLQQKMAEWKRKRQEDPVADLKEALVAATRAAELVPESPQVFKITGMIYSSWATWLSSRRETDKQLEMIAKATEALQEVPDSARDSRFYDTLGAAYSSRGALHSGQGIDARPDYKRAISAYRSAVDLHPRPYQSSSNLGLNLRRLSLQPGVENRTELLEEAVSAFERARDVNPESPVPHYYLGLCYLGLAQDGDPFSGELGEEVDKALEHYRQGQQINPKMLSCSSRQRRSIDRASRSVRGSAFSTSTWVGPTTTAASFWSGKGGARMGILLVPSTRKGKHWSWLPMMVRSYVLVAPTECLPSMI
jgi:tetratricopeptide (TPR) repeat protein